MARLMCWSTACFVAAGRSTVIFPLPFLARRIVPNPTADLACTFLMVFRLLLLVIQALSLAPTISEISI